jgi:hypothetical protein
MIKHCPKLVHLGVHSNSLSRAAATVQLADFGAGLEAPGSVRVSGRCPAGWLAKLGSGCVCALALMQLRIWLGSPRWSAKI